MADISSKPMRKLVYPLTYPETVTGYSPDDGFLIVPLGGVFAENETRVKLEVELSLEEYVALASCVDVGADIAYGEDWEYIWWIWVRAVRGLSVMDCNGVADCIDNSSIVQGSLYQWAVNAGIYDPDSIHDDTELGAIIPQSVQDTEVDILADCGLDVLWGSIVEIVNRLDDQARTILETAITYNDVIERIGNVLSAIPLIGSTISSVQKAFSEAIPDVYNLFNAYSSQANKDAIACAIFELVCAECRYPTYAELYDVYSQNAVGGLTDIDTVTLRAVIEGFTASGSLASSVAYNTVILVELFALYAGSRVLNVVGIDAITLMAQLGADNPSSDWQILCDACQPPVTDRALWDFTLGDGGFVNGSGLGIANAFGIYNGVDAWIPQNGGNRAQRLYMVKELPLDTAIEDIGVQWERISTSTGWDYQSNMRDVANSSAGQITLYNSSGANALTGCFSGVETAHPHRNYLLIAFDVNAGFNLKVTKVRVKFTGTIPSGAAITSEPIC